MNIGLQIDIGVHFEDLELKLGLPKTDFGEMREGALLELQWCRLIA